ncbi:MAG: type II secretion system F family protein [Candidatus Aenigmatarchaeota archaeon]
MKDFDDWRTEDYIKYVTPIIGFLIILVVSIVFQDIGMISVTFLFTLVIGVSPYMLYRYYRLKKINDMESQFPNFLKDLVESKRSGMTLPQALASTSNTDYGELSSEIKKMHNQLSWGIEFEKVLELFSKRLNESDLISRSMKIVVEAYKSGGEIVSTMETLASDATTIKEAEKTKKSKLQQYIFVMYIIYFMFLGIALVLGKVLIQIGTGTSIQAGSEIMGGSPNLCKPYMDGGSIYSVVCSFFFSICGIFGFGEGAACYYRSLFFSMIMVEGIFSGLIIGQIENESIAAGFKHSLILSGVGFVAYILITTSGIL